MKRIASALTVFALALSITVGAVAGDCCDGGKCCNGTKCCVKHTRK